MNEYKGKRLVAAVAVLALVLCAFVAFMPTESDATDATIPANGTAVTDGLDLENNVTYVASAGTYKVDVPATAADGISIILMDDAKVTLNGVAGTTAVKIFAATSATNYDDAKYITLTSQNKTYESTVSNDGGVLGLAFGEGKIVGTDVTLAIQTDTAVSANGTITSSSAITGLTYGVYTVTSSAHTYYAVSTTASTYTLDATVTTVNVMGGNAIVTDGTNTVSFQDIVTTTPIAVTSSTGTMSIGDGAAGMTGDVSMTKGKATISTSTNVAKALNGLMAGTTFGSTLADVGITDNVINTAVSAYGDVEISGDVTLVDSVAFSIEAGATVDGTFVVNGTVSGATSKSVFGELSGTISPNAKISLDASAADTASTVTLDITTTAATTIAGNFSVDGAVTITDDNVTLPNGSEMRIVDADTVVTLTTTQMTVLGKISGPANGQIAGTVVAKNVNAVKPYVTGTVNSATAIIMTDGSAGSGEVAYSLDQLIDYLNSGNDVQLKITTSGNNNIVIGQDVTMDGNKLTIIVDSSVTDFKITVSPKVTWEMINESVVNLDGVGTFELGDRASLIIDNSNLGMPVNVGNGITDVSGDVVTIDNATGDVTVGFGREYVLTGNIATANIDVIGKLTISGELSQNSNIVVMQGGSVTVDDRFTALGTVTVNVGGTFTIAEGGAMTVGNNNGAASLTINTAAVGADDEDQFVIAEGGSLTIASNSSNSPPNNLVIATAASFDGAASTGVVNNGTLTMNGSMTGALKNNGAMTFNGVAATGNAIVYLLENKSITVSAVSGPGTLTVSDLGVLAHFDRSNVKSIDGNDVVMKNVKGVSIASVVDSVSEKGVRYWTASMTVSGAFTSNGTGSEVKLDSVTLAEATTATDADNADKKGNISINAATTVGKNVTLVLAGGEVSVDATVTAGSEGSTVTVNAENAVVTGSIVIVESSDAVINNGEKLSAAMYTVTTTEPVSNTIYYTSFDAALGNISEADEDTIYVYGTTEANTTATIPADTIVVIEGTLKIASDVTLTAADGSDVSGNVIDVKGTFVAEYYTNNVDMEDILADVIRIDGNEYTFTSLANALADAGEGDVIELSAETVVIDVDTQIPVGVTVKSDGSDIVINADVTLTVAGTLDVVNATVTADPDVDTANGEKAGKIVVTGTSKIASDEATEPAIYTNVAGAHYSKTTNRTVYYVSSIANAAANADEYLDNGAVSIIGQVAAEDVTFTKTDKMDSLTVTIAAMTGDDNNTSVTVGKLTLDGAKLVVNASQTKNIVAFSGNVAAMTGAEGSEVESVIGLKGASSITVESYTDDAPEVPVSYLLIDGQYKGAVTISSGAATVGTVNTSGALAAGTVTASGDNVLTVAQNATLVVGYDKASGARALAVNAGTGNNANAAGVVVDGTISVGDNGTVTINGIMDINGTVDVQKSESTEGVQVKSVLNVNGALNISAVEGETGVLNVAGIMYVAAEGAVAGPVAINADKSDYIFAYDGADLSAAQIEWVNGSSTAETTTAYINGAPYMTIYVDGSINNADVAGIMDAADIRIPGLTTPATSSAFVFYSDADCKEKIEETVNVGKYDAVYTKFAAAKVYGTVSEGVGFTLFIDGVPASNAAAGEYPLTVGTHTVSYDIKVGYSGENAQLTFNGQTIQSGATIEITADMDSFTIAVTGATPADLSGSGSSGGDDGMGLTDYLLIILVILIVVMAIMVAMRLMRS